MTGDTGYMQLAMGMAHDPLLDGNPIFDQLVKEMGDPWTNDVPYEDGGVTLNALDRSEPEPWYASDLMGLARHLAGKVGMSLTEYTGRQAADLRRMLATPALPQQPYRPQSQTGQMRPGPPTGTMPPVMGPTRAMPQQQLPPAEPLVGRALRRQRRRGGPPPGLRPDGSLLALQDPPVHPDTRMTDQWPPHPPQVDPWEGHTGDVHH